MKYKKPKCVFINLSTSSSLIGAARCSGAWTGVDVVKRISVTTL